MSYGEIARGASRAFTILLLGGAIQPVVARLLGGAAQVWLPLVALVAFTEAARVGAVARDAVRTGAIAALAGYGLILPLSLATSGVSDPALLLGTAATAVVVGGAAGAGFARWSRSAHRSRRGVTA